MKKVHTFDNAVINYEVYADNGKTVTPATMTGTVKAKVDMVYRGENDYGFKVGPTRVQITGTTVIDGKKVQVFAGCRKGETPTKWIMPDTAFDADNNEWF